MEVNTPVQYHDPSHKYFLGTNVYRSATTIVSQFYEKFDTEERVIYMTERYGRDPQYWKAKWEEENRISLVRGSRKHDKEEQFLYNRGFTMVTAKSYPVFDMRRYYNSPVKYIALPDGTYPELKLWRHDWKIAGRADKPTFETLNNGQRYAHIEDYKTNKSIDTRGFNGRKMLEPLTHLEDCEWTHYTLQLSLYQYMLEYFGFRPGIRRIIHFPHEIEGLGTPDPVPHELPYLRDEVISMLSHLKSTGWLAA